MKNSVSLEKINKSFAVATGNVQVLKDISFTVPEGSFSIIYGPSGSGKSTLLHAILGLETPDSGLVEVMGKNVYKFASENDLAEFRKTNIGMVYQQANWVRAINVLENVALPLMLLGEDRDIRFKKAEQLLKAVGMLDWAEYKPMELSSSQQQKVSLARALINNPDIIIADEPTGNLDFENGEELMLLLKNFQEQTGKTVLMVTHDLEYLKYADQAVEIFDGKVERVFAPKTDQSVKEKIQTKRKKHEEIA
jgi:putative ABC transport system ATP-binding protein